MRIGLVLLKAINDIKWQLNKKINCQYFETTLSVPILYGKIIEGLIRGGFFELTKQYPNKQLSIYSCQFNEISSIILIDKNEATDFINPKELLTFIHCFIKKITEEWYHSFHLNESSITNQKLAVFDNEYYSSYTGSVPFMSTILTLYKNLKVNESQIDDRKVLIGKVEDIELFLHQMKNDLASYPLLTLKQRCLHLLRSNSIFYHERLPQELNTELRIISGIDLNKFVNKIVLVDIPSNFMFADVKYSLTLANISFCQLDKNENLKIAYFDEYYLFQFLTDHGYAELQLHEKLLNFYELPIKLPNRNEIKIIERLLTEKQLALEKSCCELDEKIFIEKSNYLKAFFNKLQNQLQTIDAENSWNKLSLGSRFITQ